MIASRLKKNKKCSNFIFFFCNILKITNPCNHHRWAQTLVKLHFPETDRVNANNHRLHGAEADGRGTSVRFQFDELDTCECDECCFLATTASALLETLTAKSLALQLPLLKFFFFCFGLCLLRWPTFSQVFVPLVFGKKMNGIQVMGRGFPLKSRKMSLSDALCDFKHFDYFEKRLEFNLFG